jgi:hypothetical protein
MNIERFHVGIENRNIGILAEVSTKNLMERLIENGGLVRYNSVFPMDETGTRTIVETVKTKTKKISIVDNIYIVDNDMVTITDLVWEIKEKDWKIDKFWILEINGERINLVS